MAFDKQRRPVFLNKRESPGRCQSGSTTGISTSIERRKGGGGGGGGARTRRDESGCQPAPYFPKHNEVMRKGVKKKILNSVHLFTKKKTAASCRLVLSFISFLDFIGSL